MIVTLRPNTTITDAEELILLYYSEMGKGVKAYDQAVISDDNNFTIDQLNQITHLVNRLGGHGIPSDTIETLINRRLEIDKKLHAVPSTVSVLSDYEAIPWDNIKELIDIMRVPYLGLARLSKMLHKKRPNIVPILDKIVRDTYLQPLMGNNQMLRGISDSEKTILYIKELKKDVDNNGTVLLELRDWQGKQYDISVLRILDIFIWCACGPFKDRFAHLIKRS